MIFKAPIMLLLLAGLPLLGKLLIRAQRLQDQTAAKLRGEKPFSNHWKNRMVLPLSAFTALILALAQPAWNPHPGPAGMQGRDLVIALDISRSMLAQDVFPSRLGGAKIALFESLDHLRGQRIGLITFAGAASVRVPLTLDHNFIRYMLDRAQPSDADVGGTSLQSAIEKAIDVVLKESEKGKQDLIILTDGEDLLSDIEKTAEELRDCGARVLIVGIGDPIEGARIPDIAQTHAWMQYKGEDVITRLDEAKLLQLAAESPNVMYVPVQTRPFDLITIYRKMLTDTTGIPGTESGQMMYTEGYPWLIALGLILFFLLPRNRRILPALAVFLIAGCSPNTPHPNDEISTQIAAARTQWAEALPSIEIDPGAALSSLKQNRAELMQLAIKHPGDLRIAQQIAGLSRQVNEVDKKVAAKEQAEKDLQKKLQNAIEELALLTQREATLSQQSQQMLKQRPPAPPEEKVAAAPPTVTEQTDIGEGTGRVLSVVQEVQSVVQKILTAAYGNNEVAPPTEFDDVVDNLAQAKMSQSDVIENLNLDALNWPQANSSLLTATRRMQEALTALSDQNKGSGDDQDREGDDETDWDFDEDMEWSESDMPSDMSMPMNSQNFKTSLDNQSLPSPNYTAEEILTEEAANMEQRAAQKASQAGAKVEKNW